MSVFPNIVYMGTPHFAVEPLKAIVEMGWNVSAVVTVPDKPAGRGQKIAESPVKTYALQKGLNILQPEKLKNESFIESLKALKPDIIVVVAFRMLPEAVWQIPSIGTFNLHASLLPHYRGAAPINWAVINGETKTGITTFLIDKEIDTGKVLFREEIAVGATETAGELHDKLMVQGGALVVKTIEALALGRIEPIFQNNLVEHNSVLKPAPKLFKETCKINWENNSTSIYNLIRGLSPYPCAWSNLTLPDGTPTTAKIIFAQPSPSESKGIGNAETTGKTLTVSCGIGSINITHIQPAGKKVMESAQFLRGLRGTGSLLFW